MIVLGEWNTQIRNWDKQQKSKNNSTFAKGFGTNQTDDQTNTKDPGGVPEKIGHIKNKFRKLIFDKIYPNLYHFPPGISSCSIWPKGPKTASKVSANPKKQVHIVH